MKVFYVVASIGFLFLMIQSYKLVSNNLKTENQKYRLVLKDAQFEIKHYPSASFFILLILSLFDFALSLKLR